MENNTPRKILYRSDTNKIIFGVCGGLGEYFEVDPIFFRIGFVLFSFGAGSGLAAYLIATLLMPRRRPPIPTPSSTAAGTENK